MTEPVWTSLEIAKLAVSILTPVLLVGLGVIINRAARRVENIQWASRKLIERRLELFDEMAPSLNDLFCFFNLVGRFQQILPPDAVRMKRDLDRTFYVNEYLLSDECRSAYQQFMVVYFETFVGTGQDARLRTPLSFQQVERGPAWRDEWAKHFSADLDCSPPKLINDAYLNLMRTFAADLGVVQEASRSS